MQRGENPKRIKKRILILASAALSLTTALLAWFCIPKEEVSITQIVADDESALKVDERILDISPEKRHFKVNLQLDFRGGSAPANVHVAFIDADGNTMTEKVETVKSSWSKKEVIGEDIRKSAKQIKITVKKQKPEEEITIKEFEPIVF